MIESQRVTAVGSGSPTTQPSLVSNDSGIVTGTAIAEFIAGIMWVVAIVAVAAIALVDRCGTIFQNPAKNKWPIALPIVPNHFYYWTGFVIDRAVL